jgi:hypothetical protein
VQFGKECLFHHGGRDQRRDPLTHYYEPVMSDTCDTRGGTRECARGDECPFAHNRVEVNQHPIALARRLRELGGTVRAPPQHRTRARLGTSARPTCDACVRDAWQGAKGEMMHDSAGHLKRGELLRLVDVQLDKGGYVTGVRRDTTRQRAQPRASLRHGRTRRGQWRWQWCLAWRSTDARARVCSCCRCAGASARARRRSSR